MDAATPAGPHTQRALLRVLGVGFGLAVTVGNTVGSGILGAPGEVAAHLPAPAWFIAAWVAGGLYALAGALSLAELAVMLPRSGGFYVFAARGLGHFPAFVVGWTDWLAQCGTIASTSLLVGQYAGALDPALSGRGREIALFIAIGLALVQARGVRWGGHVQNVSSALKGLGFVALVAGLWLLGSPRAPIAEVVPVAGAAAWLLALQAVIYTYDGWYGVIYFGDELRAPARAVPRAMIGGVLLVMGLYLAVNVTLMCLLPMSALAGAPLAVGVAAGVVFGASAEMFIAALAILSLLGGINACHLMSSRIPWALSRDELLPAVFARVNAGGTPTLGLWAGTAAAVLFILSGSFREVMAVLAFFFVTNYVIAFVALFALRRRAPDLARPVRAWGYPIVPGLALGLSLAFLVAAVAADRASSLRALFVLGLSYPVYRLLRRNGGRPADVESHR